MEPVSLFEMDFRSPAKGSRSAGQPWGSARWSDKKIGPVHFSKWIPKEPSGGSLPSRSAPASVPVDKKKLGDPHFVKWIPEEPSSGRLSSSFRRPSAPWGREEEVWRPSLFEMDSGGTLPGRLSPPTAIPCPAPRVGGKKCGTRHFSKWNLEESSKGGIQPPAPGSALPVAEKKIESAALSETKSAPKRHSLSKDERSAVVHATRGSLLLTSSAGSARDAHRTERRHVKFLLGALLLLPSCRSAVADFYDPLTLPLCTGGAGGQMISQSATLLDTAPTETSGGGAGGGECRAP